MADDTRSKPEAEPRSEAVEPRPTIGASQGESAVTAEAIRAGAEVAKRTTAAAVTVAAAMAGAGNGPLESPAAVEAVPQDISGQTLPGASFGDFVRNIGLALADAQGALDENSVEAAIKLAETEIPALIALNQVVNEDGEIESVTPVIQNAKLIQYIQPTFYQWAVARLFGRFDIRSFENNGSTRIDSSLDISQRSANIGGGASFGGGFFGRLSGGFSSSRTSIDSSTQVDSSFASASSSGSSFFEAELRPREDTRFPPPIIAIQGPRLTATATATSLAAPADPAVPAEVTVTFTLFKRDGFQSTGDKVVAVVLEGPGQLERNSVTLSPLMDGGEQTGQSEESDQMEQQRVTTLQGSQRLRRRAEDEAGTAVVRATIGTLNSSLRIDFPAAPAAQQQAQ